MFVVEHHGAVETDFVKVFYGYFFGCEGSVSFYRVGGMESGGMEEEAGKGEQEGDDCFHVLLVFEEIIVCFNWFIGGKDRIKELN